MSHSYWKWYLWLFFGLTLHTHASVTVTFDDLPLAGADSYWNGADESGGFTSHGVTFNNLYNTSWSSWSGFSYSNVNDPDTPGWGNQYAVFQPGTGVGGAGNYALVWDAGDAQAFLELAQPNEVTGFMVNNTAYAALAIQDGDDFTKKFSAEDQDWFMLSIEGWNEANQSLGSVEFYLADFRADDPNDHYILDHWAWVDLTMLGSSVKRLDFSLSSSDVGAWGMNNPSYFAMDNLTVVPEPGTLLLTGYAALLLGLFRRKGQG